MRYRLNGEICGKEYNKNMAGQPTVMTEEVLIKLKEAFLIGCNNEEASLWAGIAVSTFYNYTKSNPEYLDEVEQWKRNPIIKARNTVYKAIDNPETARWYLERKSKDEFGSRLEMTGAGGKPLIPSKVSEADKAEVTRKLAEQLAIMEGKNNENANTDGSTIQPNTTDTLDKPDGS